MNYLLLMRYEYLQVEEEPSVEAAFSIPRSTSDLQFSIGFFVNPYVYMSLGKTPGETNYHVGTTGRIDWIDTGMPATADTLMYTHLWIDSDGYMHWALATDWASLAASEGTATTQTMTADLNYQVMIVLQTDDAATKEVRLDYIQGSSLK